MTEAHGWTRPASPWLAIVPSGPTTTAAAAAPGHASIWLRACTAAILDPCRTAGSPATPRWSRASDTRGRSSPGATCSSPARRRSRADGSAPPDGAYDQARLCIEIIGGALEQAGASLDDVVRTRIYVVPGVDFDEVGRAHGEAFGDIRPATAGLVVHALLDPRWLVEIEADAILPEPNGRPGTLEQR